MKENIKTEPKQIWAEFENGQRYKDSIGEKGIREQATINERFYCGDQWHGVQGGGQRPLTRRNVIKRIGEYKMSVISSSAVAVNYGAEGVPDNSDLQGQQEKNALKTQMINGEVPAGKVGNVEIAVVMNALSDYYRVTAERLKFDDKLAQLLKNAYLSGTGILYTYWDSEVCTGLYADERQTMAIKGDIACEVLDIENVVFGDPNNEDVESQPYIIIARRLDIDAVRREAEKYGQVTDDIVPDGANGYYRNAGDRGEDEPADSKRVTVITKIYKKYDKDGNFTVWGKMVTEKAVVRPEWNLKIHRYPIAKFVWERRRNCAYGDSEVTYQIPNQIALNQLHFFSTWAMQNAGMPKIIVNGDLIPDGISNDPGEIIKIYGSAEDMAGAIKFVVPPNFSSAFVNFTDNFAGNILADSGANDAALGDMRPDNATAIVQAREAAIAPMQVYKNRFYSAVEDIARIWADFWFTMYGRRSLKINTESGTEYITFDAERYKNLIITARIDVGASTIWSEAVSISNLNGLLTAQQISFIEYLERLPKGLIPDVGGLLNSRKEQAAAQVAAMQQQQMAAQPSITPDDIGDGEVLKYIKQNNPQVYEKLMSLSPEDQQRALSMMRNSTGGAQQNENMVGDL
ncbi:MAG: hypothetical protein IJY79_04560 [Clostridia bacterium]|nr:hypothetical protein [Clostridia bacterium]